MKKYLKKRLSIFMTIVMMVSLLGNMNWTVHAEEPAPQPGTYAVYYDGNGGADIQVNGVSIQGWNDFMGGDNIPDKLSFKLTPPDFVDGETPIVDIIELDGNYGSEPLYTTRVQDGDPNKISIGTEGSDFTFEFTPRNNNPLEVNVWWTEYSFFEGTDDKPIILEIDHHGEGCVNVQGVASTDAVEWRSFKKVRVASGTTGVTLTWEKAENKPEKIRVEGGDPNSQDGWLELTESHYSGNSCIVPLNQTIQEESGDEVEADFYYIQVIYPDDGPQPGTFNIHYDDRDNAGVVWGENVTLPGDGSLSFIDPSSTEGNTIYTDIKLTFHVPDGLEKTSLEVKIHDVTFYDNGETKTITDDKLKTLFGEDAAALFGTDQDGNVTFSYTPTCDEFINMQVNWIRPQGTQPGTFQIHYDDRDNAGVVWGEDVTLPGEGSLSFIDPSSTEGNTIYTDIKLTFHVPDGLEKTSLEVKIHDVTFYDNGETKTITDDKLKTLFGEDAAALFGTDQDGNVTFSYTPTCNESIDMQVNWIRPQGTQPGTFSIRYDDRDNAGVVWGENVTLPGEGSLSFIDPSSTEGNTIYTDIKLTFHVPDGLEKTSLEVKFNGTTLYDNGESRRIEDERLETLLGTNDAATLFGTDAQGNVFFAYTPNSMDNIMIEVNWLGDVGPQPGTLNIHYDDRDNAKVVWGEDVTLDREASVSFIDPSSTEENPVYNQIKLTFYVPDGLEKTSLDVRVHGQSFYDNGNALAIEDEHLKKLFGEDAATLFGTDTEGNVTFTYTPTCDEFIDIEVYWIGAGDVEEDGSPAEQIASHGYAYFVRHVAVDEQPAVFKHYFATEIWYEYFIPNYNGYRGPFAGQFGITSLEELKNKLTVEEKSTEPDAATGLYYCSYSLDLGEEEEPVTGKAYVLDSKNKFIVQTGDVLHCVEVQYNPNENGDLFPQDVMVKGSGEVKVFGNGTCMVGGLDTGSASSQGWHVTQEHSGIIHETNTPWHDSEGRMGGISCRLIVCEDDFSGAVIKCERDAAAWNFVNVSIYDLSENQGEAVAEVYYGSDTVSFETVNFDNVPTGNLITGVSLDTTKISAQAATITASQTRGQFDLHFNTGYDSIPVIVEFEDGTTRYVTINRVGLKMNVSSEDRNKFTVWHGTDHSVLYDVQESGDTKAIYATFYYAGDARPANPVSLFTTITTAEGVERKLIDTPVTMDGTKVEWENTLGEANQGTDKFYDDFLIWSGTEEEYNALQKVEAIVFDAGNDDAFGGVKVGSGTGVVWTKER